MEIYCTRPRCPRPQNHFPDLDDHATLRTAQQKYCTTCGMPLILVGRYLPKRLLGRGGFGAAFLARDRYTPGMRECVVKQFQPANNLSPTQLQLAQDLFEREAVVLEEIGHQHEQIPDLFAYFPVIVPSLQAEQQEQFFYLVQEYIDGQNLEEELTQKGKYSEQEALEILREILKVLKFVHEKGIIHRDIKPSNIMRHRNGKLYLLDFGAVKQVTNSPIGGSTASTGIYSMGFAPPEQMSGGQVFPSTDLYALAVTVLMLLTGEVEITQLFDAYSNQWKWQSKVTVSQHFADVLDKMLLSAANQRYQSAQEVLDALDKPAQSLAPTHINPRQPSSPQQSQPQPQPIQSQPQPPKQSPVGSRPIQPFSILEILGGAAFSGFEGGLIAVTLFGLLQSPIITFTACALILGILIFAQTRRWIEKWDLLIIPGITFAIIYFLPFLHSGLSIQQIILLSIVSGLVAIAFTALFRLIYKLLSLLL
ncbi:serine/threonine-protein kinase [Brasilonema sp. UFV-L1]|uniref:serine/threonine-protein kinase n=1 Tax=Brasilonema sp. UFV-L1 TaxID=2234130 RepID=UPI00145D13DB|nr:serine/threonine-protein kinase [Brasilonema sp. UFV-L1]NMG08698.1 serine/threonine protein kinase [Brasilonema sp. UFV-L1]